MFCPSCGNLCVNSNENFCNSCGSALKDGNLTKPKEMSNNASGGLKTLTFEEFLKRGSSRETKDQEQRQQTFNEMKKRKSDERTKSLKKKKEEIVKINSGLVECGVARQLKVKKGSLLPLDFKKRK
ncbi:uncharacterized protein LOC114545118 [Dendronephthya gigantea]|uniref:uncharacterized protein LOC114542504 n=1 Tax=Dendronephthya gigantea TaxID=151771 RepID=UPI00106C4922|nr:uncharacterized protein LOC114542504 [Dendronephthya gigantea]XP_028418485.1 uncharacterized protein LOC114543867 [Dendronephthya gigantea]XP_028419271.1 uncharacterized protein LOC114545118 [Dendronephthya gigantea]